MPAVIGRKRTLTQLRVIHKMPGQFRDRMRAKGAAQSSREPAGREAAGEPGWPQEKAECRVRKAEVSLGCRERQVMWRQRYPGTPWTTAVCPVTAGNTASQGRQAREWKGQAKETHLKDAGKKAGSSESGDANKAGTVAGNEDDSFPEVS